MNRDKGVFVAEEEWEGENFDSEMGIFGDQRDHRQIILLRERGETMSSELDYHPMLAVALAEARLGLKEGGIPIGAAIFDETGQLIGAGHNRRVQQGDPSMHGETDAFPKAGRQKSYRKLIMGTTLGPGSDCRRLGGKFVFFTGVAGERRKLNGKM